MEQDQNKLSWPIRTALFIYRRGLSPILESTQRTLTGHTGACRFQPTCSDYAELSFQLHGPARGSLLTLRRLSRCHPFARGGFDPVPARDGRPAPIPEKNEPLEPSGATGHLP